MKLRVVLTLLFVLVVLPCMGADLDAEATALAKAFLEAAGSNEADTTKEAVDRLFSTATIEKVGRERLGALPPRIRETFGELELHHVEVISVEMGGGMSHVAHVFVKRVATGEWHDLQFRLDPGPPVRFKELAFVATVTEPVALPAGAISDPSTLEWLDRYVTKLADKEELSGAILIAMGDDIVFERYFGEADANGKVPVTAETRFSMGSGNKMMTALIVAGLVENGKLRFSTKMRDVIPAFPASADADKVTIHHLLSHTSGIGEYWTDEFEAGRSDVKIAADFLPWITKRGFDFSPGTNFGYSNSNFILAGLAAEKVSGLTYSTLLEKRIFEPAGMKSSVLSSDGGKTFADPLVRQGDAWVHSGLPGIGSPAGGAWTTTRDMLRFSRALKAGRYVPQTTLDYMTTSKTSKFDGATNYGYGFILESSGGIARYGHGGTAPGVAFDFQYFPKLDVTFVVMSNQDNAAYDDLRKNAIRLITGER